MLKVATVCSGIGSPEVAIEQLSKEQNFEVENVFACDIDKYARSSYLANFTPGKMFTDMTSDEFHLNAEYSDLFIGGIPCQAFSLAGKRLGELDKRGLLFYDFYRYVKEKQPKVFIIENVKGLLSDNKGKTFSNWIHLLARSVNQQEINFPHPDSLEYNIHHTVLNSKNFGVPQNRERVFIVGIRKDLSNNFGFPVGWKLDRRLKDVLETDVDEKYYLSEKMINGFLKHDEDSKELKRGFKFEPIQDTNSEIASCVTARCFKMGVDDNYILMSKERRTEKAKKQRRETGTNDFRGKEIVFEKTEISNCITTGLTKDHYIMEPFKIKEATIKGFDFAESGDSINFLQPNSQTRRGRVGKQIANTIQTLCNQAVVEVFKIHSGAKIRRLTPLECFRLQAFPDEFFYKAKAVNSDTQLYKQAGNSITSSVMKAIIKNLLPILL